MTGFRVLIVDDNLPVRQLLCELLAERCPYLEPTVVADGEAALAAHGARPFCLIGLEDVYDVKVSEFRSLDAGGPLTKSALQQGIVDVGLVLTSDGALDQFGLQILTDDKELQASDNIVPVVNQKAMNDTIRKTLDDVSAALTQEALRDMNYGVDWERQDPATVAQNWLTANGLA